MIDKKIKNLWGYLDENIKIHLKDNAVKEIAERWINIYPRGLKTINQEDFISAVLSQKKTEQESLDNVDHFQHLKNHPRIKGLIENPLRILQGLVFEEKEKLEKDYFKYEEEQKQYYKIISSYTKNKHDIVNKISFLNNLKKELSTIEIEYLDNKNNFNLVSNKEGINSVLNDTVSKRNYIGKNRIYNLESKFQLSKVKPLITYFIDDKKNPPLRFFSKDINTKDNKKLDKTDFYTRLENLREKSIPQELAKQEIKLEALEKEYNHSSSNIGIVFEKEEDLRIIRNELEDISLHITAQKPSELYIPKIKYFKKILEEEIERANIVQGNISSNYEIEIER